jgi:mycofactocin system glycosyltransferase
MLDPTPPITDPGIRMTVTRYLVDPPVRILPDPRGPIIARAGSRRAVVVNQAGGEAFWRLAPTGVLCGSVPAELAPAESRLMSLLARRGLAQAETTLLEPFPRVSIIVPTFGRMEGLRRCLRSIGDLEYPAELLEVIVVDDDHPEGARVADEAARIDARLIRRAANGGPAASRNSGAAGSTGAVLAFVDSDCVVPADWLTKLLPELADRDIWAVAARVRGIDDSSVIGRYETVRSPLDMGAIGHDLDAADGRFFVPSANLIMSREAFTRLNGFDPTMRTGEDVDLCLRVLGAAGRVRYVATMSVGHERRRTLEALARQRIAYAASEARLVSRYPALTRMLPIPLVPASAAMILTGSRLVPSMRARCSVALGLGGAQMLAWRRWSQRLWPGAIDRASWASSIRSTGVANIELADGLARQFARHHLVPVSLLVGRFRPRRSIGAGILLLAWAGLSDFLRLRPRLDPVRFVALHALDDLAYNLGLALGAIRERSLRDYLGGIRVTSGLPRSRQPETRRDGSAVADPVHRSARGDISGPVPMPMRVTGRPPVPGARR